MTTPDVTHTHADARKGVLLGVAAYFIWGFFPVYFKAVRQVPPFEMVAHRVVWSLLFLTLLVSGAGEWSATRRALTSRRTALTLCGSTLLIATNWLVFIYAVGQNQVLQSSLGYFITPLVSVLCGFLFLGERLRRLQQLSLLCAVAGVSFLAYQYGRFPWISLLLAVTFGLYGLVRKTAHVEAMVGLTVETILTGPLAIGYLLWLGIHNQGAFLAGSLHNNLLLPLSGVLTAVPLIWFAAAARRLRLSTIGFLQYLTPTLHFLLAVLLYGEEFTSAHLISFLCIWTGLAFYSWDALRHSRDAGRGYASPDAEPYE
jgi:chloramphenicol-sensitive protein RarD